GRTCRSAGVGGRIRRRGGGPRRRRGRAGRGRGRSAGVGGAGGGRVLGGQGRRRAVGSGRRGRRGIAQRVFRKEEGERDGIGADHRVQGFEGVHEIGRDGALLHMHRGPLLHGARGACVGGAEPLAFARRIDAVLACIGLVLHQHPVAYLGGHAIDGLQPVKGNVDRGRQAHGFTLAGQQANGGGCRSGHEACSMKKAPRKRGLKKVE
ncbi:MAG: hypothetical protein E5W19_30775, partial [Mesorhizobium sp.]